MQLNTPMILTLLRMALIPVLVVFFYLPYGWTNIAVTAVFVFAAVTDWADGYLARRMNQMSQFGAFLDPVADKLMVATALVVLVEANPKSYFAVAAAIIIGREIVISALREWMSEMGQRSRVRVSGFGKLKTIFQMTAISFLLYHQPIFGLPIFQIGGILLYIAAGLTLWSMWVYLSSAWPILMESQNMPLNPDSDPESSKNTQAEPSADGSLADATQSD